MTTDLGSAPRSGWASLVSELLVSDLEASLVFWLDLLGFRVAYHRPAEHFAYLERIEGAQIMLHQRCDVWETGPMERPFGRGVMFQIYVENLEPIRATLDAARHPIHAGPQEIWRRHGDREGGQQEISVLDPDGYLIMLAERLGHRPISDERR